MGESPEIITRARPAIRRERATTCHLNLVPRLRRPNHDMVLRKSQDLLVVEVQGRLELFQSLEIDVPDLTCGRSIQLRIVKTDVDSRFEGLFELSDLIGSEEQNSRVVLKNS